MIPLCSSIEDGSNLSASVYNQSSDCCIRAGLQIWWAVIPPARKYSSSCRVYCVRDRRIKEPFRFFVENETGYNDRRDSVLLQSDYRAHAVEALFGLSNRPLHQLSGVLVHNVSVLLYVSNRIKIGSQADGCQLPGHIHYLQ